MNYLVTYPQLRKFMTEYLNDLLNQFNVIEIDRFIAIDYNNPIPDPYSIDDIVITDIISSNDTVNRDCNSKSIEVKKDNPSIGNGEIIKFGAGYSNSDDRYALNYGDNKFYTLNKVRALRAYENQTNQARSIRATAKSIYSHELDNNEDRIWWERDVLEDTGNTELDSYFK